MRNPFLLSRPSQVSFSGGRTSGLMLWKIREAFGGRIPHDVVVTFANTGKEVEETYEFIRDCEAFWSVPIHWIEYRRDADAPILKLGTEDSNRPLIGCHDLKMVNFDTASRKGEPFMDLISSKRDYRKLVKGLSPVLPNPTDRWCTGELKSRPMKKLMRYLGFGDYSCSVGIRADEAGRAAKLRATNTQSIDYVCPLVTAGVVLADVMNFWSEQTFDLKLKHDPQLGTYYGNCDGCFLKKQAKIKRIMAEKPGSLDWWAEQEEATGQTFRRDRPSYRQMANKRVELTLFDDPDLGNCMCTD